MALEMQHLAGGYGVAPVIQDINLALQAGQWLSLVGANGSGKSTLLKLLCRILQPQQGKVFLDGKLIHCQSAQVVAQKLAFLPQQQTVPPGLTVWQLVSLGRSPHQPWWQWELDLDDQRQVQAALVQTQMESFSDRPVEHLSGGERQRAFLALALAQNPKVLMLDEPTTYLDLSYQLQLLELLKQLKQHQKLAIITVLHDVNLAARYSDRLAMLHQGCIQAVGPPAEVLTPANIRQVFGVTVVLLQTPVGPQICPLAACESSLSVATQTG